MRVSRVIGAIFPRDIVDIIEQRPQAVDDVRCLEIERSPASPIPVYSFPFVRTYRRFTSISSGSISTVGTEEPRSGNNVFRLLKIVNKDVISNLHLAHNDRNFAVINEPQQSSGAFQKRHSSEDIGMV
jgi:hypothetical protein